MRLTVLLMLTACGATPTSYPTQVADAACDRLKECEPDAYDQTYDNDKACTEDLTLDVSCAVEHCESFDNQLANDCVADIRDASCSGFDAFDLLACLNAYTECSELELAACLLTL